MVALAVGRVTRPALAAAAALALLAGGTACGERKERTGPLVQVYPVTVQGSSVAPTVVDSVPRRIVPLGAGPRRILRALGLERRTVTVNDSLVGLPLVDQIKRARPDLILASSDADPLDLARAKTATHAAVYVELDSSVDDVVHSIDEIGLLTGEPVAARKVTGSIERARRRVAARLSGIPSSGPSSTSGTSRPCPLEASSATSSRRHTAGAWPGRAPSRARFRSSAWQS